MIIYYYYYGDFDLFKKGIKDCLENLETNLKDEIEALMSLKFQIIHGSYQSWCK